MTIRSETLSLVHFLLDRRPDTSDPELLTEILARAQTLHCMATTLEHDLARMGVTEEAAIEAAQRAG